MEIAKTTVRNPSSPISIIALRKAIAAWAVSCCGAKGSRACGLGSAGRYRSRKPNHSSRSGIRCPRVRTLRGKPLFLPLSRVPHFLRQCTIHGHCSRTLDQHRQTDGNGKEMVFKSFALLCSGPIHKEAVRQMHRPNSDEHVDNDSERCNAA